MKFDDYHINEDIKYNLEKLGFKKPTDIQYKSIPPILRGEDVLAIAQTGTGKTAAFAIPIIHLIHEKKSSKRTDYVKCVVLAPTHELALQITEVFETIANKTRVKIACIFGGVDQQPQIDTLYKGVDIVIATPGRMFDLQSQGVLDLSKIDILVLDEADHMLDLGFIRDIQDMIHFLPKIRQTLFFSATINENIKKLAYSLVKNAIRIQISPKDPVSRNIQHAVVFIESDDKRFFLERIINEHPESKILIFVRTKVRAERVAKAMERVNIKSLTMHSDKDHEERTKVMNAFKKGTTKILIATDINARGIDIPNVDYVVNYDLPEEPENYVHRVGRTGRGDKKGQAISFCSSEEKPVLKVIETFLHNPIHVIEIDREDKAAIIEFAKDNVVKEDLNALLREVEELELKKKKKRKK
ncbi:MAG TPA: DEAD/DEAH box helicase [Chitinophagales bacterium]|jgi:ATP-dependent RNA helicase RhlE|nr:DEAD/DEAH box helicase [Chitinophagales bacterium]